MLGRLLDLKPVFADLVLQILIGVVGVQFQLGVLIQCFHHPFGVLLVQGLSAGGSAGGSWTEETANGQLRHGEQEGSINVRFCLHSIDWEAQWTCGGDGNDAHESESKADCIGDEVSHFVKLLWCLM